MPHSRYVVKNKRIWWIKPHNKGSKTLNYPLQGKKKQAKLFFRHLSSVGASTHIFPNLITLKRSHLWEWQAWHPDPALSSRPVEYVQLPPGQHQLPNYVSQAGSSPFSGQREQAPSVIQSWSLRSRWRRKGGTLEYLWNKTAKRESNKKTVWNGLRELRSL